MPKASLSSSPAWHRNQRKQRSRARHALHFPSRHRSERLIEAVGILQLHHGSQPPASWEMPAADWIQCKKCQYYHRRQKCPAKCWCGTPLKTATKWENGSLAEQIKSAAAAAATAAVKQQATTPPQKQAAGPVDGMPASSQTDSDESRRLRSAEISRLEQLLSTFTDKDSALTTQVEKDIADLKTAQINAKPLDTQIQQLEELLQRKKSKMAECDATIMEAHSTKQTLQQQHTLKSDELALLKQRKAQESLQALNMPSPDAQLAAQLQHMQQQLQQMMGLFSALSTVQGLPPAATEVLGQAQLRMGLPATAQDPFSTPVRDRAATLSSATPGAQEAMPHSPDSGRFGGPSPLQPQSSFGPAPGNSAAINAREAAAPYLEAPEVEIVDDDDTILQDSLQQAAVAEAVASAQASIAQETNCMDLTAEPFSHDTATIPVTA